MEPLCIRKLSIKMELHLHVCLVTSKSKVAPLQSVSIPRLELMGAVLGSKLAQTIASVLTVEKNSITFWIIVPVFCTGSGNTVRN